MCKETAEGRLLKCRHCRLVIVCPQRFEGILESRKRRAGRPTKPVLNRSIIAEHALELVVAGGLDKLTMGQLAKRLGVATSALYNHVDNKADIVLLIQDALVSKVSLETMLQLTDGEATLEDALLPECLRCVPVVDSLDCRDTSF